jgi:hypothetical protein
MNDNYVSTQICVYKTNKVLVEFMDKLKPASTNGYAHLHATGDSVDVNGRKEYSLIGITMLDYSKGKGDKASRARANISPDEAKYIYSRLYAGFPTFELSQDKIFGTPDGAGQSDVTKLYISRQPTDNQGNVKTHPWYIHLENGKGISVKNRNGGTYMQSGSYIKQRTVSANLTDLDMFKLMSRVTCYISAWESAFAPSLIANGRQALAMAMQQASTTQQPYYSEYYPDQQSA